MWLYLARHGETEWNVENRVLGRTDIPLNERGLEQARQLALSLRGEKIDKIFCSPLMRAVQTAEAVSKELGVSVEARDELIEHNFGIYEGYDRRSPVYQAEKVKFFARYEGGESFFDVAARVYPFIEKIKREYGDDSDRGIMIVTHNGISKIITTYFEDLTNDEFRTFALGNCQMRKFKL